MQIQNLHSSPGPSLPSAAPPRPTGQPSQPLDVCDIGRVVTAPSLETREATASPDAVVHPPSGAPASVPTVLLEQAPAQPESPQRMNLQEAVKQAASATSLSAAGVAAAVTQAQKLDDDLGDQDDQHVAERVAKIVKTQLGVEDAQITPEASYKEDLGADSLDSVELLMSFQDEFGIEIPEEDASGLTTVGLTVTYIENRLKEPKQE